MTEQRYQAVLAVLAEGRAVMEVASQRSVSRRTVHRWFDILAIRLFGAALGESVGILLVLTSKHETVCQGLQDCFRDTVLGVGVFAVLLAAIMAFIALPTTILWSHGVAGLRPELRWPWPSSWGHRVIVAIVGAVLFFGVLSVLGIPLSAP